jgi:hypothetical protein
MPKAMSVEAMKLTQAGKATHTQPGSVALIRRLIGRVKEAERRAEAASPGVSRSRRLSGTLSPRRGQPAARGDLS